MIPEDLYVDTHNASRKAPTVWDALDGSLGVDGSLRRAAELRKDLTAWRKTGERLRQRIAESVAESEAHGLIVAPKLEPSERAFFDTYEPVEPGDPPLPPRHDDNS